MKIIFFGLGSIGLRHASIILEKYHYDLYAYRSGFSKNQNLLGIKEIHSWGELKKIQPDVAFVTNPTALHIKTALKCAEIGLKLFIEKPIGSDVKNLDRLLNIVKKKKLVTYIAYNRRFHPVIKQLKKYFDKNEFLNMRLVSTSFYPDWRKNSDYKNVYSASKKMGGGVVLDLSHEIDYTQFLLGEIRKIHGCFFKRSDLTIDAEDMADILILTNKGPVNIHLNIFSQKDQNTIEINFDNLSVIGDLINSTVEEYKRGKLVSSKQFDKERNISFESQLEYFFKNINNPEMLNNLIEAAPLYRKIIRFKKSHGR